MTKILYVFGGDYAASEFDDLVEAGTITAKELWDKAAENLEADNEYSDGEHWFEYEALLFEHVHSKFVAFVKGELLDYDSSKHSNIYIVE